MMTIRDHFDKECSAHLTFDQVWTFTENSDITECTIKLVNNFSGNARYWNIYLSECTDPTSKILEILSLEFLKSGYFPVDPSIPSGRPSATMRLAGYDDEVCSDDLFYTGRVNFYVDVELDTELKASIIRHSLFTGLSIIIRDRNFAMIQAAAATPIAFISHDSRDKDILVRDLAAELTRIGCPVWYDEYSLKIGDSLRESIEAGLKETKKCILILSPHFLENRGWGRAEYDSVFTRELIEKNNVILPVWHNVSQHQVYQYSPRLADKVGLNSNIGTSLLSIKLKEAILSSNLHPQQLPL